jgi:hypothetical protein
VKFLSIVVSLCAYLEPLARPPFLSLYRRPGMIRIPASKRSLAAVFNMPQTLCAGRQYGQCCAAELDALLFGAIPARATVLAAAHFTPSRRQGVLTTSTELRVSRRL